MVIVIEAERAQHGTSAVHDHVGTEIVRRRTREVVRGAERDDVIGRGFDVLERVCGLERDDPGR